MSERVEQQLQQEPQYKLYYLMLFGTLAIVILWSVFGLNLTGVEEGGIMIASNIITGILNPDLGFLFDLSDAGVLYLLLETMAIAFLGTIFGSILSIPVAFIMAPSVVGNQLSWLTRILVIMIRTLPAIVYGLMLIRVTGPGPFAGVLTMSLTSIGMVSKLYVDVIEEIDRGILEAMTSMGATTFDKIRFGILPQLVANFVSITVYRFDMNLRDASILGLVGAGGIGAPLIFAMNSYRWREVGSILIGLIILILIIEVISTRIRKKLVNG